MLLCNLARLEKDGIEMMDLITPPTLWDGIMKISEKIKLADKASILKNQDKCQ
jgi:spore maturation protein SpmA